MTRYSLTRDLDTGRPCMIMDPDGPWVSAGEAERMMREMQTDDEEETDDDA